MGRAPHWSAPPGKGVRAVDSLFICGAGHSGSTLLGMVLGGTRGGFYAGEAAKVRYLHDRSKPLRKRACKICGEDCPVWGGFQWNPGAPLHAQIAARTGADLIIDSTKRPDWIEARAAETRAAGGRAGLIFLQRDGRAVINSRIRKYPGRDPAGQIDQWLDQMNSAADLFERFQGPKLALRYETFASDPDAAIRQICEVFALQYDPAMLDYEARPHHPLGGNSGTQYVASRGAGETLELGEARRGYYAGHPGGIALDQRWTRELSSAHAALFETMAGPINAAYRWDLVDS